MVPTESHQRSDMQMRLFLPADSTAEPHPLASTLEASTEPRPQGPWNITPRHNAHMAILSGFCSGCRLEQRIHTAKTYSHVLHFQSSLHAKCHLRRPAHAFDQKHLKRQTSSLVIHCRHWHRDHGTSRVGSVGKRILYNRCGLVVYGFVGLLVSRCPQALSKH
jgi:hypothetical protein